MKRFAFLLILTGWLVPLAAAQETEHVQIGIFADYMRLSESDTNFGGLGARVGFVAYKNLKLEAEMGYDFTQAFTERFTNGATGTVTVRRSNLRILHGEFGPKVNLSPEYWHFHPFVFVKGGFMNRRISAAPATIGTFFSSTDTLRTDNVSAVLYPGGGLEGRVGPVGVRLDVGDEINFASGAHHNLRVTFGPYIRF
jgi:hypothetical protein